MPSIPYPHKLSLAPVPLTANKQNMAYAAIDCAVV